MSKKSSQDSDVEFIQALAGILKDNELTEVQVKRDYGENNSLNVRVSRKMQAVQIAAPLAVAPGIPAAPVPAASDGDPASDPASDPGAVSSPMVGTIYLQSEPDTPPFVTIGQQVSEGDTILIIEAMKTMNQIPAPRSGKIKRILVDDGSAVEFGAPLMIIE